MFEHQHGNQANFFYIPHRDRGSITFSVHQLQLITITYNSTNYNYKQLLSGQLQSQLNNFLHRTHNTMIFISVTACRHWYIYGLKF